MAAIIRKTFCIAVALAAVSSLADVAVGQGFYQNGVRRNPVTGELEIIRYGQQDYHSWVGPAWGQRGFYGATINPFDGTVMQSTVVRNPVTGHVEVQNQQFNPWTGASVGSNTYYNPFTQRYETYSDVVPPSSIIPPPRGAEKPPADAAAQPTTEGAATEAEGESTDKKPKRELPRVIETNPLLLKPFKPTTEVKP